MDRRPVKILLNVHQLLDSNFKKSPLLFYTGLNLSRTLFCKLNKYNLFRVQL